LNIEDQQKLFLKSFCSNVFKLFIYEHHQETSLFHRRHRQLHRSSERVFRARNNGFNNSKLDILIA